MITEKINITKLTASEGHILTDGEAYGKEIYLGCNDSPENWQEITREEYERIQAARRDEEMRMT